MPTTRCWRSLLDKQHLTEDRTDDEGWNVAVTRVGGIRRCGWVLVVVVLNEQLRNVACRRRQFTDNDNVTLTVCECIPRTPNSLRLGDSEQHAWPLPLPSSDFVDPALISLQCQQRALGRKTLSALLKQQNAQRNVPGTGYVGAQISLVLDDLFSSFWLARFVTRCIRTCCHCCSNILL